MAKFYQFIHMILSGTNEIFTSTKVKFANNDRLHSQPRSCEYQCTCGQRTSDSLNEGLPIKMARKKFHGK